MAKEVDLEIEILDPAGLKARGYQGCLRVGAGSSHPPRMVILRHVPRKASRETVALVGKGITFDTGGISLKPGDHMWEMKGDMAGAAAVLYGMRALGRPAPDVKVVGILCCAENFPDAMLDLPINSPKDNSDLAFEAWTERIPPVGTKVTMILEPVLDEKK